MIHVGVIPIGPHRGKVVFVTWDRPEWNPPLPYDQGSYWGILDPEAAGAARFVHAAGAPGEGFQEITCCSQSWTIDGRWFLAGGQTGPGIGMTHGLGSKEAWIYDPNVAEFGGPAVGAWFRQPRMEKYRYYPTVLLTQIDLPLALRGEMIVTGGSIEGWPPPPTYNYNDDYETFLPGPRGWPDPQPRGTWKPWGNPPSLLYPGPTTGAGRFKWYPRLFLLPNGRMVNIATEPQTTWAVHPTSSPASWSLLGQRTISGSRGYGAALLFPNIGPDYINTVVNLGGDSWLGPTDNVEWANAATTLPQLWPVGYLWTARSNDPSGLSSLPPLIHPRKECCAVILPDGSVLLLHDGRDSGWTRRPELLSGGQWHEMAEEASRRDHHAIALLLPSGRVLSGSGNNREWDLQVYEPPYLSGGEATRPVWGANLPDTLLRQQQYMVSATSPAGTVIQKVVMMRPGSLTHHADMDQRYVELLVVGQDKFSVTFQMPDGPPSATSPYTAPLGYWMLFLVTDAGVPSVAKFVKFE